MQTWKDQEGREWTATCPITLAMDLKAKGLDLLNPDHLAAAYGDPLEFLKLAAKLHLSQMQERGLAEIDMLDIMTSSEQVALDSAAAVEAALKDFFLRIRGGKALAAVLTRSIEAAEKTTAAQVATLGGEKGAKAVAAVVQQGLLHLTKALDQVGSPRESGEVSGP